MKNWLKKIIIFRTLLENNLRKFKLSREYLKKYYKSNLSIKHNIKLFLDLFRFKNESKGHNLKDFFVSVKSSKIIINQINSFKLLFIFDRPVSEDYWEARDKWGEFHKSPKYEKIDERAFHQYKSSSSGNLLLLSDEDLSAHLHEYLLSQMSLSTKYGDQIILKEFVKKPYTFLIGNDYLINFPQFFLKRIKSLASSDKSLTIVPSIVEPWPNIDQKNLEFNDLSPVEFGNAPLLHDFCYMIMKHEMYGSRRKNHKPFLFKLFNEVQKIETKNSDIFGGNFSALAKKIHSIVSYNEFLDAYILMMLFHCYVKFHATGRFLLDVPQQRLMTAIHRHVSILNKIRL